MSDKSEQPTDKRLRDAREKGEVIRSTDVTSAVLFILLLAMLSLGGGFFWQHLEQLLRLPLATTSGTGASASLNWFFERVLTEVAVLSLPVICVALVGGVAGSFLQVRALLSLDPIIPKLERLNPAEGFKRLFSARGLINVVLMIVKVILLGAIVFYVIRGSVGTAVKAPYLDATEIKSLASQLLMLIAAWAAVVYCICAAADYFHQHYQFIKEKKMSKDEVFREYKEMEGDPFIKGKRKAMFAEIAFGDMMESVSKASVVVVNPTHIAVAIYYQDGKTALPVIVAKGSDQVAAQIRAIAEKSNVPIMHNVKLARRLFESTPLNHYVGEESLEAVAEVLRWVKRLHDQKDRGMG